MPGRAAPVTARNPGALPGRGPFGPIKSSAHRSACSALLNFKSPCGCLAPGAGHAPPRTPELPHEGSAHSQLHTAALGPKSGHAGPPGVHSGCRLVFLCCAVLVAPRGLGTLPTPASPWRTCVAQRTADHHRAGPNPGGRPLGSHHSAPADPVHLTNGRGGLQGGHRVVGRAATGAAGQARAGAGAGLRRKHHSDRHTTLQ